MNALWRHCVLYHNGNRAEINYNYSNPIGIYPFVDKEDLTLKDLHNKILISCSSNCSSDKTIHHECAFHNMHFKVRKYAFHSIYFTLCIHYSHYIHCISIFTIFISNTLPSIPSIHPIHSIHSIHINHSSHSIYRVFR